MCITYVCIYIYIYIYIGAWTTCTPAPSALSRPRRPSRPTWSAVCRPVWTPGARFYFSPGIVPDTLERIGTTSAWESEEMPES